MTTGANDRGIVMNDSPEGWENAALTRFSASRDTARMRKVWTPPWRWVFGVATALGLFSWVQAYRLTLVNQKPGVPLEAGLTWQLLVLNLALWYVPALLMPAVVRIARQFPLDAAGQRLRAVGVHAMGALLFAAADFTAMLGVRFALWTDAGKWPGATWPQFLQRALFDQLDWMLMVYAVIVGASHAIAFYHESQQRKLAAAQLEARLMEARLKTLEAELHPHFLFNTLHAISTLVHRDPDSADRMISRLSDLLRITFDRSGDAKVSLKEEIDFLQKYLDIEQMRFQDRLAVSVSIDPDALDGEVPRMILQPIVENAIKHGPGGGRAAIGFRSPPAAAAIACGCRSTTTAAVCRCGRCARCAPASACRTRGRASTVSTAATTDSSSPTATADCPC